MTTQPSRSLRHGRLAAAALTALTLGIGGYSAAPAHAASYPVSSSSPTVTLTTDANKNGRMEAGDVARINITYTTDQTLTNVSFSASSAFPAANNNVTCSVGNRVSGTTTFWSLGTINAHTTFSCTDVITAVSGQMPTGNSVLVFTHLYAGGSSDAAPPGTANIPLGISSSNGTIPAKWQALGGANGSLGNPIGGENCNDYSNVSNTPGCYQQYDKGFIFWTANTGAWSQVYGPVRDQYGALGVERGKLGFPTSDIRCGLKDGGCTQDFENGLIAYSPNTGAHAVYSVFSDKWRGMGLQNSSLGYPTNDYQCNDISGASGASGCYQGFQNGFIFWSPNTGAWSQVNGPVRDRYGIEGVEHGHLGFPTSDVNCGLKDGGCFQHYEGGSVYYRPNTGAYWIGNDMKARWGAMGWENSTLGYPTDNPKCGSPSGVTGKIGCYQSFQNGYMFEGDGTNGAWEQYGPIRRIYEQNGVERGKYGYPTGPIVIGNDGSMSQTYEGGTIAYAPAVPTDDGNKWNHDPINPQPGVRCYVDPNLGGTVCTKS